MRALTLVGQMGAGKSTLARLLAARWRSLGFIAVDLDLLIARTAGVSVPELFAREGEAAFRVRERAALDAALSRWPLVLATGGGAPCAPGAMDAILAAGPAVWLDAPPAVLARRALGGGGRPLLAGLDQAGATELLAAQRAARAPHYARATFTVDAAAPAATVLAAILALVAPEEPWP